MRKAGRLGVLILVLSCAAGLIGCSSTRGVSKPKQDSSPFDNALISAEQDQVRKKLGEPNVVCRTVNDHILWIYRPSWKILPNDKGTLYVEFENGKVIKIFEKK
jgi:hypothetical protein